MFNSVSLRVQVIALVGILGLSLVAALLIIASTMGTARESIVRSNKDRLATLTESLSRRYGSVIGLIAPSQFSDPGLAEREELTSLLRNIKGEELADQPDVHAGFYHSLWNREISEDPFGADAADVVPFERYLRAQLETTLELRAEQWSHNEIGDRSVIVVTRPVFARERLVGSAWSLIVLDDVVRSWPSDVTALLLASVVIGIVIAFVFLMRFRREIEVIQKGLVAVTNDLSVRLPTSNTELGNVARSVNAMADTIAHQQAEREAMQRVIQQKEKMASLGQLIAGVAHEIRTPLSVIKTRVQLWQRTFDRLLATRTNDDPAWGPASMSMVIKEMDRIERIVRKLLYFSKQRTLHLRPVPLTTLIDETLALLSMDLQNRGVRIVRRYPPNELVADVDEAEVKEVFLNIILNAMEAMPTGGTIEVFVDADTPSPRVRIRDTGGGMSADVAQRIFEPFYSTKESGTGLGLSIAHEIVRAHQADLSFVSSDSGTEFTITFKPAASNTES